MRRRPEDARLRGFLEKVGATAELLRAFRARGNGSLEGVVLRLGPSSSPAFVQQLLRWVGLSEADLRDDSLVLGQLIERSPVLRSAFLEVLAPPGAERSASIM
jgi:hypothetical protein